jgi:predicted ester cyclase
VEGDLSEGAGARDARARARQALEDVCARGDFDVAMSLYREDFVDHVNDREFRGQDGIRESVGLYRRVLSDLHIRVEDQVAEGDRVASRWRAEGFNRGRRVSLNGITISRIRDGRIAEDWSVSDTLGLLRQLGLRRSLLLAVDELARAVRPNR